jgi:hypothetical protein
LSCPKRLLVGAGLPKALEPGREGEPKGEVLKMDVPNSVEVLLLDPVVVTGEADVAEEAPDAEDRGGKEKPDDDAVDEPEPSVPKLANVGGAGTDDGCELGADDNVLVKVPEEAPDVEDGG